MAAAYRGDTFRAMSRALCLAALFGLLGRATASPRNDPTTGRAVFTGATVPGATSIDLNPAAIGLGATDEVLFAAMTVIDQYAIDRSHQDPSTGALSPGERVRDLELAPGGLIAGILHVKDRVTLGGELRSAPADVFLANQEALRYHTLGGNQRTWAGTIGTSVHVTNDILFGLSLAAETTYLRLHYARDTALANGHGPNGVDSDCGGTPCGVENPVATERYDVQVNTPIISVANLTANLGIAIQLAKDVWLGVAYHTPPGLAVQTELVGTMDVRRAPRDGGDLLHGGATVELSQPASADAELRARLAYELDLHIGMRWIDLSRLAAFDVRGYGSTFPGAKIPEWTEIPRGYHDPLAIWAGVEQVDAGEALRLGGRLGFETSTVATNLTSPMGIGPTSVTADVGAQLRVYSIVVLQASYGLQYFPTVNVTNSGFDPRDQIACIDSGFDYATSACQAVRLGYAIPTAAGSYGRLEHALRVSLRFPL
jgi:long-subunit fatty acid transport protein